MAELGWFVDSVTGAPIYGGERSNKPSLEATATWITVAKPVPDNDEDEYYWIGGSWQLQTNVYTPSDSARVDAVFSGDLGAILLNVLTDFENRLRTQERVSAQTTSATFKNDVEQYLP